MKLAVYFVKSTLNLLEEGFDAATYIEPFAQLLRTRFDLELEFDDQGVFSEADQIQPAHDADCNIVFVLTGGTEAAILRFGDFHKPIFLRTFHVNNSLAAAMEAREALLGRAPVFLSHESDTDLPDLARFLDLERMRKELSGNWLSIGGASDWLVSSDCRPDRLLDFGIELVVVKSSDAFGLNSSRDVDAEIEGPSESFLTHEADDFELAREFAENAAELVGLTEKDISYTLRSFPILGRLIKENSAKACTIRCIDIISDIETSVCLPVSLLNDRGVVTSCEGDLRTLFSMVVGYLSQPLETRRPSFMGNLSDFNRSTNRIVLSHCTIPRLLLQSYSLETHFETRSGVAIHGIFEEAPSVTVFCVDLALRHAVLTSAHIIKSTGDCDLCRTQAVLEIPNMDYVGAIYGNHQVLTFQKLRPLKELLEYLGFKCLAWSDD